MSCVCCGWQGLMQQSVLQGTADRQQPNTAHNLPRSTHHAANCLQKVDSCPICKPQCIRLLLPILLLLLKLLNIASVLAPALL